MDLNLEIQKCLEELYANNGAKIKNIVNSILSSFGGIFQKDYDDFYSVANECVAKCIETYDGSTKLDSYIYSCVSNKVKSEITRRNRYKRKSDRDSISLNTPIDDDEDGLVLADALVSDFDVYEEMCKNNNSESVYEYLNNLSNTERDVLNLLLEGYSVTEIQRKLPLTIKQINNCINSLQKFENVNILNTNVNVRYKERNKEEIVMENTSSQITQTQEKSKLKSYSIISIIKKMQSYIIRFNHPAQRESEQWPLRMKGDLISDILQGNPIPALVFAEQIIDGISVVWDLDGKQRCTNVYSFYNDGFKIPKNIRRPIITYQAIQRDENGDVILNENSVPKFEIREFDIRNKKYSQLPTELQEKFNDYTFDVTQYLNCSDEDILYHIARYNEGKPMSSSQKGIICLGSEFVGVVKSIAAMSFFKNIGNYTYKEFKNGTINRVVVETIMATEFLNNWKKNQEEMCTYIKDNASIEDFENLEDTIDRLEKVITDDLSDLFVSKDTFIWFTLFNEFKKFNLEDEKFAEFLMHFKNGMCKKEINGTSFVVLNENRATRDKKLITDKLNYLKVLMNNYFNIDNELMVS